MTTPSVHETDVLHPEGAVEPMEEALPLAPAQRRLWYVQGLDPDSSAYSIPFAFDLRGPLREDVLEAALLAAVERHESLRTVFDLVDGEPLQIFRSEPDLRLEVEDLSGLEAEARSVAVAEALEQEAGRRFDLRRGPLLVSRLLRLGPEEHLWLLTIHHIVFDGWSLGVLVDEVRQDYRALAEGLPSPVPEPELQYADYGAWLDDQLRDGLLERQLAFWSEELADYPTVLRLPTDRPRPARQTFRGDAVVERVPEGTVRGVRELARRGGATEFMAYLALWQALLGRLTGEDRFLVGSPVSGRERQETEGLIGMLVNTLPLRGDLEGDPGVEELLARTRGACQRAFGHQDVPFDRLVEELKPERHASFTPLVQIGFAFDSFSDLPRELAPEVSLVPREFTLKSAKSDLTLLVRGTADGINCLLEYNSDLFDRATARRWLRTYLRLAAEAIEAPERPISALSFLGEDERELVTCRWSGEEALRAADRPVVSGPDAPGLEAFFARCAAGRPDAVAVSGGAGIDGGASEHLTFAGLDAWSGRIARRLRRAGVVRGETVALVLDRSVERVAALLGIVRAGAAYLPVDADAPPERLHFMLEDAGAERLVTRSELVDRLPDGLRDRALLLDRSESGDGAAETTPLPELTGDDLAYVIYTSGSTGRPKGVAVSHGGVARLVLGADHTDLGPDRAVLQFASVSFDAATLELWGPLLTGGRVVVPPTGPSSPRQLAGSVAQERVTTLFLTTAFFNQTVEEAPEAMDGLLQLTTGGEQASPEHFRRALERCPDLRLSNLYGPTENTTYSTHHPLPSAGEVIEPVPIGRPIAGSSAYVVDARLRPVPPGVVGEMLVGGDGVARGYVGRPALTAERFIPDPFSSRAGARLYRTGDLTRWLGTGVLEFVGRNDNQVKVRGFRIEPGEIELALLAHPDVAEALVTTTEARGTRELVAYVVADAAVAGERRGPDASLLRTWLLGRLPEFMVPSAFVALERFPLNASGKVDRRALPDPERRLDGDRGGYVAPRTPLEELVAAVWEEILGVEGIGIRDDFFELGGHSLVATRVLARLGDQFGLEMPLQAIFEAPTVESLTRFMGDRLLAEMESELGTEAPSAGTEPEPGVEGNAGKRLTALAGREW